jgi:hypothetical protein
MGIVWSSTSAERETTSNTNSAKPSPVQSSKKRYFTFRLSLIPESATEVELRAFLNGLPFKDDEKTKILSLSLVPFVGHGYRIATVTFKNMPSLFSERTSEASFTLSASLDGDEVEILVDTKFLGITPVYSGKNPNIE